MIQDHEALASSLRHAFASSAGGVVALVDRLIALSPIEGLRLEWRDESCRIQMGNGDRPAEFSVPFEKTVFRAMLARVFSLFDKQTSGTITPYGGEGDFAFGPEPHRFHAAFANTPAEQFLQIRQIPTTRFTMNEPSTQPNDASTPVSCARTRRAVRDAGRKAASAAAAG